MTATRSSLAHLVPAAATAYHRNEIAHALRRVCSSSELYWNSMSEEEFVAPMGRAWSPADHVRHLTKSVRAVTHGLRAPRILLRVLFGRPKRGSMSYEALVATYHRALRNGGQAGRFTPSPTRISGSAADYRREILGVHRAQVTALATRVLRWNRHQVDGLFMPHPLLGKLTVREMLLFTLYHNQHHVLVVARRRGEYFSDTTPLKDQ